MGNFNDTHFNLIILQFQFPETPQLGKDRVGEETQLVVRHFQDLQVAESFEDFTRQLADAVVVEQKLAQFAQRVECVVLYHLQAVVIEIQAIQIWEVDERQTVELVDFVLLQVDFVQMHVISECVCADNLHLVVAKRDVHEDRQVSERKAVQFVNLSILNVDGAQVFQRLKDVGGDKTEIAR